MANTVLTQLFSAPELDYSWRETVAPNTEEWGISNVRSILNYFLHGFQHGLAMAQEIAMDDGGDGLLIPGAFYAMTLSRLMMDDAEMANIVIEGNLEEMITETVLGQLNKTNLILWSEDEMIVLNLNTVTEMLND